MASGADDSDLKGQVQQVLFTAAVSLLPPSQLFGLIVEQKLRFFFAANKNVAAGRPKKLFTSERRGKAPLDGGGWCVRQTDKQDGQHHKAECS